MTMPVRMIEKLREWRGRPERDLSIGPLISERATYAKRAEKRIGSFVDLWEGVMGGELACRTRVTALRSGVAHVTVDSSSTAYEVDRQLREGLEQKLRQAFGKTLIRVRITVGQLS